MRLEPVTRDDLESIRFLQPDGWPDIIAEFEAYIRYDFCWPVKAVSGHSIIGTGAAIAYGYTGWLAHIIVDKHFRNRGIGREITGELMRILNIQGKNRLLLIATELGYPVYLGAGFREVSEYVFLKRSTEWRALIPSDYIIPYRPEYHDTILELDRVISGEDRAMLIGPALHRSMCYVEGSTLTGCYMPGIGEGPIIAMNGKAGTELMKIKYAKADRAVFPSENFLARQFLGDNGFVETGTRGIRMHMGEKVHWQPERIYSRIGGNFG
jgi:GNAT superfamily N-acetyltransferase